MRQPDEQEIAAASPALIALGSNLDGDAGPPYAMLRQAVTEIGNSIGVIAAQSRIWQTPCFPPGSGPDYANAALCVSTTLAPAEILQRLHAIEAAHGRARDARWGSRTLDLDLLALGELILPDRATHDYWRDLPAVQQQMRAPDQLILPHPRLQDRAFVLVPLAEVAPDWVHPILHRSVRQMLADLPAADRAGIIALQQAGLP